MVDGNRLGEIGFQKLGTPYKQMDCQAFIEWCLARCGMRKDLAGSNAWYREVKKNGVILTPEECVKQLGCVPKGAFLFIHAYDGGEEKRGYHDGLGNASHIGICTGNKGEGAIHSSKSSGCVAESKFKGKSIRGGWNAVGLWNKVNYDYGAGGGGTEPAKKKTLRRGDKGTEVVYVQAILMDLGYDLQPYGADGDFGKKTEEAVKKFQQAHGLEPDGIVGEKTLSALENDGYLVNDDRYTIILRNCTQELMESIKEVFPDAEIQKEG